MTASPSVASPGFEQFGLNESIVRGIRGLGFETPRPIQSKAIPAGLDGRDVLGLAQTGTGKTAAFALPLMERLLNGGGNSPRALVLAPTRELATQIATEIQALSRFTRLKTVALYGGVSVRGQMNALRKRPQIVVGCPGRVLDLLQQGILRLRNVETLVMDEADHMFDMGFLPDIRKILASLPAQRQNLLFSATMPKEIRALANDLLENPEVVELADAAPASTIDHALYPVTEPRKRELLEHVLGFEEFNSAIVFTRTKHRARHLADHLSKSGHRAVSLQGNMSQAQRDRAMKGFRTGRYDILVATDIAARGIDVSGVSHVINFDVPNTPEAYTHRIGRTGRAELQGTACTFFTTNDRGWVRDTKRMIGSRIPLRPIEGFKLDPNEKPQGRHRQSRGRPHGGRSAGRPDARKASKRRNSTGTPGRKKKRRA